MEKFERKFNTLAESLDHRFERVTVQELDFHKDTDGGTAIHVERPFRGRVYRCRVTGNFEIGVGLYFALYGELDQCFVQGPAIGYVIGNGLAKPEPWPDATHSNSQSNLASANHCRFGGTSPNDVGFVIDGAGYVRLRQCAVEGQEVQVAFDVYPRAARAKITLEDCWLECPCEVAIRFDSKNSLLVVDGFNFGHPQLPGRFIDASGDDRSRILLVNNSWPTVPPIHVGRYTNVVVGSGNNFGQADVDAVLVRS